MQLKILTYNIHKGMNFGNRMMILDRIRDLLRELNPDIVFLQEVLGDHEKVEINDWESNAQFEYLADQIWPHSAYGKNAIYQRGHHGNAILSKHAFIHWGNQNISTNRFESRGILHGEIYHAESGRSIFVMCAHFNLFERGRAQQVQWLKQIISRHVRDHHSLIIAGDFNDWRQRVTRVLENDCEVKEAFLQCYGQHAMTFPSFYPLLRVDRIYYKGLELIQATCHQGAEYKLMSDHLPLSASFEL